MLVSSLITISPPPHSAPEVVANKNVKRESKAYSFKEQKLEEELRREMGKKKKGGKGDGTGGGGKKKSDSGNMLEGLTKKQRELVEFELERESKIRERVTKVGIFYTSLPCLT